MDEAMELLDAAVQHLLADFEEAFRVYERLSATAERKAGGEPAQPVDIQARSWPRAKGQGGGGMLVLAGGEALVLGCAVAGNETAQQALAQLERAGGAASVKPAACGGGTDAGAARAAGTRVYAIVVTGSHELAATDPTFDALGALCARLGLVWSGGLAVGGGLVVAGEAGEPRMGRKRRARSEGTDLIIAAARTGVGVDDLPSATGDIVDAPCSTPRFIYRHKFPAIDN